jgi:ribonuclease BN (tRNA processing enzyme)
MLAQRNGGVVAISLARQSRRNGLCIVLVSAAMTVCAAGTALKSQTISPPPQTPESHKAPETAAIVLGVGSPNISAERSGTSIGIVAGGTLYLFDAGPGVERRIMEARAKLATLQVRRLGPVFITHLHRDHTAGLAALLAYHNYGPTGLVLSPAADQNPLTVYGPAPGEGTPPSITDLMNHLRAAFNDAHVDSVTIHTGVVFRDSNLTVSAFEVMHIPGSFGYRIQTSDRTIVVSGDTVPLDAVATACSGCDLLFHEVYGLTDDPGNPTAAYHTSATALGQLARRAQPKHLVVYHSVRVSEGDCLQAIAKSFTGKVTFAKDLDMF